MASKCGSDRPFPAWKNGKALTLPSMLCQGGSHRPDGVVVPSFEGPTSTFPPKRLLRFLPQGRTYRDSLQWRWECNEDPRTLAAECQRVLKPSAPAGGTDVRKHYSRRSPFGRDVSCGNRHALGD